LLNITAVLLSFIAVLLSLNQYFIVILLNVAQFDRNFGQLENNVAQFCSVL
jgi:hypothetical protein